MKPIQHPSNNDVLLPPAGASIEECRPLPITRVKYDNGMVGVWSYWQLDDIERQAVAAGAPVVLCAMGLTHPPVVVHVSDEKSSVMSPVTDQMEPSSIEQGKSLDDQLSQAFHDYYHKIKADVGHDEWLRIGRFIAGRIARSSEGDA